MLLQELRLQLDALPPTTDLRRLWVAYSGGVDSHALLHALHQLQSIYAFELNAIHIHHGLHPKADEWAEHNLQVVEQLARHCTVIKVNAQPQPKESLEETARNARYQAFKTLLQAGDYLITAHHADDQAETFLLQLLRGAGTKGLSAMPLLSKLGEGFLWRPLLSIARETLLDYAVTHQLAWIEDDSNAQLHFDRNYIRHQVIPSLKNRWPHFVNNASQSTKHCAEAESIVEERAHQDLMQCTLNPPAAQTTRGGPLLQRGHKLLQAKLPSDCSFEKNPLNLIALQQLPRPRRHNALRYWLKQQNLPLPNRAQLQQFETAFIHAQQDANPQLCWSNIQLRRHQNALHILPYPYNELISEHFEWDLDQPLKLPNHIGELIAIQTKGEGIRLDLIGNNKVEIRFRQGGEAIQLINHAHTKTLKKLFHSLNIPSWERGRIPLVYIQGELAQILIDSTSYVAKKFAVTGDEIGWKFQIEDHMKNAIYPIHT